MINTLPENESNDYMDIFNLAYVRKGDKYWTHEKKWIALIKEVGCERYLFNPYDQIY